MIFHVFCLNITIMIFKIHKRNEAGLLVHFVHLIYDNQKNECESYMWQSNILKAIKNWQDLICHLVNLNSSISQRYKDIEPFVTERHFPYHKRNGEFQPNVITFARTFWYANHKDNNNKKFRLCAYILSEWRMEVCANALCTQYSLALAKYTGIRHWNNIIIRMQYVIHSLTRWMMCIKADGSIHSFTYPFWMSKPYCPGIALPAKFGKEREKMEKNVHV